MKNVTMYDLISRARKISWDHDTEITVGIIAVEILLLVAESKIKNGMLYASAPIIAIGIGGVYAANTMLMLTDKSH